MKSVGDDPTVTQHLPTITTIATAVLGDCWVLTQQFSAQQSIAN
jgi:hypothetical protein